MMYPWLGEEEWLLSRRCPFAKLVFTSEYLSLDEDLGLFLDKDLGLPLDEDLDCPLDGCIDETDLMDPDFFDLSLDGGNLDFSA
jgi:hypothetical protein